MTEAELRNRIPENELVFTSSRSSGPGGQNVNKVSSKVELRFNIEDSQVFSEAEKERIYDFLGKKITAGGDIIIISQSERSQLRNREKAKDKFYKILSKALQNKEIRKPTKPTSSSVVERLTTKKKRGSVKKLRRGFTEDEQ